MNLTLDGKQTEGELIHIICEVSSRPDFDEIQWFNGSYLLNMTNQTRLEVKLTRYMHGNRINCQAKNQVGKRNQSLTLQVNCMTKLISCQYRQFILSIF